MVEIQGDYSNQFFDTMAEWNTLLEKTVIDITSEPL